MDRNRVGVAIENELLVALCEEGVDRNLANEVARLSDPVALCEEGVDRNASQRVQLALVERRPLRRGRG